MYLIQLLKTLFSRFLLFLLMLIYAVPMMIFLLLPKRWGLESRIYFWFEYIFCWFVIKMSFVPFIFKGMENVPSDPAVIVANHQSSFDIPVIGYILHGHPHLWLALNTLMKSPILRFILPRVAVLVDVSTPMSGMRSLIAAIKLLNGKKTHLVIFPEGGRFTDDAIHDFFGGYVIVAKKMGRPVVPVYIHNLNKVYPPNSFVLNYVPVTVTVGKPMMIEAHESDEIFNQRVYRWFVDQAQE